jgi:hypothetical protein
MTSASGWWCRCATSVKNRIHFKHRLDMIDAQGEIMEHLAGIDDFELADALYEAALKRWPTANIMLRAGARVIKDSRRPRLVK